MVNKILSRDISVLVQGKIDPVYTKQCLQSIRRFLPSAEIILSIWKEDVKLIAGLPYDCLVISDDPGGWKLNKESNKLNNVNRQLIGVQQGLKFVTKKYTLKFRTNMCLTDIAFLAYYQRHADSARYLKKKILVLDYYTRNPRVVPIPFHLSDWIMFGDSSDIKNYYKDIPLQSIEDGMWYKNHKNKSIIFPDVFARLTPEQHIFFSWASQFEKSGIKEYCDSCKKKISQTEKLFALNFIVLDYLNSGMKFLKYNPNRYHEKITLISSSDWDILRRKYSTPCNLNNIEWYKYRLKCYVYQFIFLYLRGSIRCISKKLGVKQLIKHIIER